MEIGREREESGCAQKKMLVSLANKNKVGSLDMPSNFQGLHFKYTKDTLQTTSLSRFMQMQIQPTSSFQRAKLTLKIFFGKSADMDSNTTYEHNSYPPTSEFTTSVAVWQVLPHFIWQDYHHSFYTCTLT